LEAVWRVIPGGKTRREEEGGDGGFCPRPSKRPPARKRIAIKATVIGFMGKGEMMFLKAYLTLLFHLFRCQMSNLFTLTD
jgi:hypothetical protein